MEKETYSAISLISLFAYYLKKFWILLIGAIVGVVLVLSVHIVKANSSEGIEAYEKKLASYENKLSVAELSLANYEHELEFLNEVESTSPLFKGEAMYKAVLTFNVNTEGEITILESGEIISRFGQEISAFWKTLDVASLVQSSQDNELLKASMSLVSSGNVAVLSVFSESLETAEQYASVLMDAMESFVKRISGSQGYSSGLSTSTASSSEITEIVKKHTSKKTLLLNEISKTEDTLKDLRNNVPSKYHFLKFGVLGFIAGGVVTVLILGVLFVSRNPLVSSFNTERCLSAIFLGALFINNDLFSRLARKTIGERSFKTEEDAVAYIRNSFESKQFANDLGNKPIVILSSSDDAVVGKKAEVIISVLKEAGYNASYVGNSSENPESILAVEESDAVVLLDRQFVSRTQLVRSNAVLAEKTGKRILGFILC